MTSTAGASPRGELRDLRTDAAPVAAAVLLGALGGAAVALGGWLLVVAALAGALLLLLGYLKPAGFLLAVLAVRPVLDATSEQSVSVGGAGLNAAGVLGAAVVGTTLAVVLARRRSTLTPLAVTGAVVMAASFLAAAWGTFRYQGLFGTVPLEELIRLATLGAVYLLALHLTTDPARMRTLVAVVALSAVLPALVGLLQWWQGVVPAGTDLELGRLNSTFSGPNAAGIYFAVTALLLLNLPPRTLPAIVRFGSLAVVLAALVGTYSRTGWLVLVLGGGALLWRDHKRLLVAMAAVLVVITMSVPTVRDRVFDTEAGYQTQFAAASNWLPSSFTWRLANWSDLMEVYGERPLTGYGLRAAPYVNPRNPSWVIPLSDDGRIGATVDGQTAVGFDPHNSVVKLLLEGGPLLLAVYVAALLAALWTSRRLARQPEPFHSLGRTLLIIWAVMVVVGVAADDPTAATATMIALLALTGAGEGALRHARSRRSIETAAG